MANHSIYVTPTTLDDENVRTTARAMGPPLRPGPRTRSAAALSTRAAPVPTLVSTTDMAQVQLSLEEKFAARQAAFEERQAEMLSKVLERNLMLEDLLDRKSDPSTSPGPSTPAPTTSCPANNLVSPTVPITTAALATPGDGSVLGHLLEWVKVSPGKLHQATMALETVVVLKTPTTLTEILTTEPLPTAWNKSVQSLDTYLERWFQWEWRVLTQHGFYFTDSTLIGRFRNSAGPALQAATDDLIYSTSGTCSTWSELVTALPLRLGVPRDLIKQERDFLRNFMQKDGEIMSDYVARFNGLLPRISHLFSTPPAFLFRWGMLWSFLQACQQHLELNDNTDGIDKPLDYWQTLALKISRTLTVSQSDKVPNPTTSKGNTSGDNHSSGFKSGNGKFNNRNRKRGNYNASTNGSNSNSGSNNSNNGSNNNGKNNSTNSSTKNPAGGNSASGRANV